MNKSESIKEIATALAKAQGQMKPASKDNINPHFKSKYADLASVVEAIREPFSTNGLSYTQVCDFTDSGALIVETVLMHSSGEWYSGRLFMPCPQQTPQGIGSAITYAKRYSLAAIAGLATDDDDGNEASVNGKPENKTQSTKQPAQVSKSDAPIKATPAQCDRLRQTILDWCLGDEAQARSALVKYSSFEVDGKTYALDWDTLENASAKWVGGVIGKVNEAIAGQHEDNPF